MLIQTLKIVSWILLVLILVCLCPGLVPALTGTRSPVSPKMFRCGSLDCTGQAIVDCRAIRTGMSRCTRSATHYWPQPGWGISAAILEQQSRSCAERPENTSCVRPWHGRVPPGIGSETYQC